MSGSKETNGNITDDEINAVNQLNSTLADKDLTTRKETLPEDSLTQVDNYNLTLQKRNNLNQDDTLAEQASHYISREQRRKLDFEIEDLYNRVATELLDNSKDVVFALEKLKKAQGIVIEDARHYEEALYWVAEVKKMLVTRHQLKRWSYSWGIFILLYAIIWLAMLGYGFFIDISKYGISETAGWFSVLAGGAGGVVTVLYNLSWQVSVQQAFDRQHIMKYLVQPIMGLILGAVMFFIVSAGFLVISSNGLGSSGLMAFTILVSFIAGLSQEVVYRLIESIVQRLSPKRSPAESKEDVESFEAVRKPVS